MHKHDLSHLVPERLETGLNPVHPAHPVTPNSLCYCHYEDVRDAIGVAYEEGYEEGKADSEEFNRGYQEGYEDCELFALQPAIDALQALVDAFAHSESNAIGNKVKTDILTHNPDVREALRKAASALKGAKR